MTKMTFVTAALIAATVFATQAMAARTDVAAQHATTKDCVRAPNVGAFASDPYTVPPCLPNTTFQYTKKSWAGRPRQPDSFFSTAHGACIALCGVQHRRANVHLRSIDVAGRWPMADGSISLSAGIAGRA